MGRQNDEMERLKRLRERQLSDRDPRIRDQAFQNRMRSGRRGKAFSLSGLLKDFQAKLLWMVGGAIVGIVAAIAFVQMVQVEWAEYIAFLIVFAGAVIGRVLGSVVDWRDEDWGRK